MEYLRCIKDIKLKTIAYDDEDKPHNVEYVFTDGCGNISPDLCKEIDTYYGIKGCSAY